MPRDATNQGFLCRSSRVRCRSIRNLAAGEMLPIISNFRQAGRDSRLEFVSESVRQALLDDSTFLWVGAVDDMKASAKRASAPNEEMGTPLASCVRVLCDLGLCAERTHAHQRPQLRGILLLVSRQAVLQAVKLSIYFGTRQDALLKLPCIPAHSFKVV